MLLTFKNLGVPIAANKTEGPSTTLEFMGIILDNVRMEARLPGDKVERIQASLALFQTKEVMHPKGTAISYRDFELCMQSYPLPGDPFCSEWSSSLTRSLNYTIILN